jgi:hypothetical protein
MLESPNVGLAFPLAIERRCGVRLYLQRVDGSCTSVTGDSERDLIDRLQLRARRAAPHAPPGQTDAVCLEGDSELGAGRVTEIGDRYVFDRKLPLSVGSVVELACGCAASPQFFAVAELSMSNGAESPRLVLLAYALRPGATSVGRRLRVQAIVGRLEAVACATRPARVRDLSARGDRGASIASKRHGLVYPLAVDDGPDRRGLRVLLQRLGDGRILDVRSAFPRASLEAWEEVLRRAGLLDESAEVGGRRRSLRSVRRGSDRLRVPGEFLDLRVARMDVVGTVRFHIELDGLARGNEWFLYQVRGVDPGAPRRCCVVESSALAVGRSCREPSHLRVVLTRKDGSEPARGDTLGFATDSATAADSRLARRRDCPS